VTRRGLSRRSATAVTAARRAATGLALALVFGGCGSQPAPAVLPSAIATPAVSPGATSPDSASPPASPVTASPAGSGAAVTVDQSLLSFIPITGHGLIQTIEPETTLQVARDPDLVANATGLMIASYIPDPTLASAAPGEDIAVVSVVRLRDPSADDTWFRGWRESYDDAACANAGGVARNSQTDIAARTVFIGACRGGSFTYHTRLDDGAVVVSITSIGDLHLGETVMERLTP